MGLPWKFSTPLQPHGSGYTDVSRDDGASWERITLPGPDAKTATTDPWLDLAAKYAAESDVPLAWVLAFIYSESGGNPNARNSCCSGLMQLSRQFFGTDEVLLDPEQNIRIGADLLAKKRARWFDLPPVASAYNAGDGRGIRTNAKSVWGMAEDMPATPWHGYIEKIVRAANWYQGRLDRGELRPHGTQPPKPNPPEPQPQPVKTVWPIALAGGAIVGFLTFVLMQKHARAQARGARAFPRARARTTS